MVKFKKQDYEDWTLFRQNTTKIISAAEFELVCQLHAKYHNHNYQRICTCSKDTINRWIAELNIIWNNGNQED
jgi:hypothetical protein